MAANAILKHVCLDAALRTPFRGVDDGFLLGGPWGCAGILRRTLVGRELKVPRERVSSCLYGGGGHVAKGAHESVRGLNLRTATFVHTYICLQVTSLMHLMHLKTHLLWSLSYA